MGNSQREESFATLSGNDSLVQFLTDSFDAELQHHKPDQEQEEEWQQRLCNLQKWICHLLIKNQQLRMSLDLAVRHQSRKTEGS
jgi:hypothetical protein